MSEPGSPAGCQVTSMKRGPPAPIRSNLEMRLTAPSAVRGGKNSRENHLSPDSILRLIFSLSLSWRSGSSPGVEHLELSLELSLPLLLPSERGGGPPSPLGSFTMARFRLMEGGTENLTLPASKVHSPRQGPRDLEGRTLGVGRSISASWDPGRVGKKQKETSPARGCSSGRREQ